MFFWRGGGGGGQITATFTCGSNHKVNTVAPFLLDCNGLLPIPGHAIGVSSRPRRGCDGRHFGAKETQSLANTTIIPRDLWAVLFNSRLASGDICRLLLTFSNSLDPDS